LASSAEEGRGTLRKFPTSRVQALESEVSEWGNPLRVKSQYPAREGTPGELKHLSSPRKRKNSVSSGERTRNSLNQPSGWGCRVLDKVMRLKQKGMGRPTRAGDSPVRAGRVMARIPEYRRTREIQRESRETTL
jgi:hypothetical protein